MLETFSTYMASIGVVDFGARTLFLRDFADILIIAFLIYTVIFLFKQTKSFLALLGVSSIIPVYILAQSLNLTLTASVIRSFLGVFFIALIVLFQDEFRRFFEHLATVSTKRIRQNSSSVSSEPRSKLTKASTELAGKRYGAIIVLPGQEEIERHLTGGTMLDALISEEAIMSIFDPGSPGHDGAIIVKNDRIEKFGVHLPLTSNLDELGKRGTRHSAALGLSERTDALTIVVSEETGEISLAKSGRLETLKSTEDLDQRLTDFLQSKTPETSTFSYNLLEDLIKKNTLEKVFALSIAVALWLVIVFFSR